MLKPHESILLWAKYRIYVVSKSTLQVKYSRKLISADHSANIGEFKHNFIVELVPLCKVGYCHPLDPAFQSILPFLQALPENFLQSSAPLSILVVATGWSRYPPERARQEPVRHLPPSAREGRERWGACRGSFHRRGTQYHADIRVTLVKLCV